MTSFSDYGPTAPGWCASRRGGGCGARFHPLHIAAVVLGFALWWPLGLAALAFALARRRGYDIDGWMGRAQGAFSSVMGTAAKPRDWRPFAEPPSSGNAAFDEWRNAEIARLEEERRKLETAQREFGEHLENLRRARDKAEFDAFMAARGSNAAG